MTCHSSGRSPTIAIGLGPVVTPSRMRIPRPPQNKTTFIGYPQKTTSRSDDFKRGDREDQPASPGPDVGELLADLVPEVPRQDEDEIGPGLLEALGRVDRDVRAREELPLLHRAAVHGVGQQVRPDAAVVQ